MVDPRRPLRAFNVLWGRPFTKTSTLIQRGGGPCFAEKPLSGAGIVDRFRRQHFDCDFAFELGVLRQEGFAHAGSSVICDLGLFGSTSRPMVIS